MPNHIVLIGVQADSGCVTIDAQGLGRVMVAEHIGNTAVIQNLTLTGGHDNWKGGGMHLYDASPMILDCYFVSNISASRGAGLSCELSSPTIRDCYFGSNVCQNGGGGMICSSQSSPQLENCTFAANLAESQTYGYGGGMLASFYSSPILTDCTFVGNQAANGGGMACMEDTAPQLTDCVFTDNSVMTSAGALLCYTDSAPVLQGCRFVGNSCGYTGGAMRAHSSEATFTDCIFSENEADDKGGAIQIENIPSPTFVYCTIVNNTAGGVGGGVCSTSGAEPTFTNCTLAGNSAPQGGGLAAGIATNMIMENTIIAFSQDGGAIWCSSYTPTVNLSCCDFYGNVGGDWIDCVADQYGLDGNIAEDPLFCDAAAGEYTLHENSPCLPAYNSCAALIGAHEADCGPAATVRLEAPGNRGTRLLAAYPNPLDPRAAMQTTVAFDLNSTQRVRLSIHDATGRRVALLADDVLPEGRSQIAWGGRNDAGDRQPSGVYFVSLYGAGVRRVEKLVLIR